MRRLVCAQGWEPREACAALLSVIPAFCPSWEEAAPGWLVSWLERGTDGSSQGGCSFHREEISGWTAQNGNTKIWQLVGHSQGLEKILLVTKDKHQRQFKKQRQCRVSSSVPQALAFASYVTLEKVLSFLLWKLGIYVPTSEDCSEDELKNSM